MSIIIQCDCCEQTIKRAHYLELTVRQLRNFQSPENQDALKQKYGAFCDDCIHNGKAMKEVLKGMKNESR